MGLRHGTRAYRAAAIRHPRHPRPVRLRRAIPGADRAMNASYEWLRAFVPFDGSPAQLRELLTTHSVTVDELVPMRADLAPIVVARVMEAWHHPDSDHLWVTKVD